ncbi:MAG: sodium-translocating pyrophosphatase [Candidatus Helarchaeota archaeon]
MIADLLNLIIIAVGGASLGLAIYLLFNIKKKEEGTPEMKEIANAIREGAHAFIKREYRTIFLFSMIIAVILYFTLDFAQHNGIPYTIISFFVGLGLSLITTRIGVHVATLSNVRTANAARTNINEALEIGFHGGIVMGLFVIGTGLLGIISLFWLFGGTTNISYHNSLIEDASLFPLLVWLTTEVPAPLAVSTLPLFIHYTYNAPLQFVGFGFGASIVCMFSRIGGGIYTKAADMGADLVGKVEAGIPEDDPRNPGVIADNVGDIVGDCVGMGADLYESFAITLVVSITIASIVPEIGEAGMYLSLLIATSGIIATMVGVFVTKGKEGEDPFRILNKGILAAGIVLAIMLFFLSLTMLSGIQGPTDGTEIVPFWLGVFLSGVLGLCATILITFNTQFFTSADYKLTQKIAEAAETGPATEIIKGYATGLKSIAIPIITVCAAIIISYSLADVFGIAITSLALLSMVGTIQGIDTFGPIADNAGGIVEMSNLGEDVRARTDELDSLGNSTAAIAKGFAIVSSGLVVLATIRLFLEEAHISIINVTKPLEISGLLLGVMLPFIITSFLLESVGTTAFEMIKEIRRQFKEIPGIMEGTGKPEYAKCVDISTKGALKGMVIPVVLAVVSVVIVGFLLRSEALTAFLIGNLSAGLIIAIFMSNAGGAWDNAKKWIRAGNLGGKKGPAYKAAVIGDTVGDPFKDTAGPSMNSLIKVMNMLALLFAPIFATLFI